MKKKLIVGIVFLLLATILLNEVENKYNIKALQVFKEQEKYYILQAGIYSSMEEANKETRDLRVKAIEEDKNHYNVYVGISKDKETIKKIKDLYTNENIMTYQKEIKIYDEDTKNSLNQLDILVNKTNTFDEMLTIEEVAMSIYTKYLKNS